MSDMKFTPGPWVIDTDTRPAEVCTVMHVPDSESKDQGFVYVRGAVGYWGADEKENMANAHLIAAAPDMYEALQQAITSMQDSGYQNSHVVIRAGKAALAKAEGKS